MEDSDSLECFQDFWNEFKNYFDDVKTNPTADKWETLRSLDERRVRKYKGWSCILCSLDPFQ